MNTFFAPPQKATAEHLESQFELVSRNPLMTSLLQSVSGVLAVLNEQRQIITLNHALLEMLGLNEATDLLGLRLGEAVKCVHASDEPAGCGTTKYCSTCGAAVAMVSSLGFDKPVEKRCALRAERAGAEVDVSLMVRARPVNVDGQKFLLIFLQDITLQERRAALERTFFHDINNMICGLVGASEILAQKDSSELSQMVYNASVRLMKEVAIQRSLSECDSYAYQPLWHQLKTGELIAELKQVFANHPASSGKSLLFEMPCDKKINSDFSLVSRILSNMILNALEATEQSGTVRVWTEDMDDRLLFRVWNKTAIPPEVALRIFQRNFSTKQQSGRGLGTFSMKFFGETILGGKVTFESSEEAGTVFCLSLPKHDSSKS